MTGEARVVDSLLLSPELHAQLLDLVLAAGAHSEFNRKFPRTVSNTSETTVQIVLFRASRDGRATAIFHELCDGRGPTVTVARVTNGRLIGGYTKVAWSSSVTHESDGTARQK